MRPLVGASRAHGLRNSFCFGVVRLVLGVGRGNCARGHWVPFAPETAARGRRLALLEITKMVH